MVFLSVVMPNLHSWPALLLLFYTHDPTSPRSVLLGLREPPTASSVIKSDEDISDGEASSDQQPPSSSASLPSQNFDVDSNEGFSNPVAFPNKWASRERAESKAHGSSAPRPPPPPSSRLTVRFNGDGGGRCLGVPLRGNLRCRKESEATESRPPAGETGASEEPALRGDLDGESLLQVRTEWVRATVRDKR